MSWLDGWLNQTVSWEAFSSGDDWEGNTYASAVSILARKEATMLATIGPGGAERRQGNTIWVAEDVAVGDTIDGEIVQGRNSLTDMDGESVGYELRTEP
jgi:hypothetical protein